MTDSDLECVVDWIHRDGPCPTDRQFAATLERYADKWAEWRLQGMDTVADSMLDAIDETVKAMRDLI